MVISGRARLTRPLLLHAEAARRAVAGDFDEERRGDAYRAGAAAVIPITGMLWSESYARIRAELNAALADPSVSGIFLQVDSPGGEVAGCFDLADAIFAARQAKPVFAALADYAYSAAYALASAANAVSVPRTGGAGSIGVVALHVDVAAALEQAGVAITAVQFGARKTDGAPFGPLSDRARASWQADVDATGEIFVATVARNRRLKPEAVAAQEAGTFQGARAVQAGLADFVLAPDAAFRLFLDTLR